MKRIGLLALASSFAIAAAAPAHAGIFIAYSTNGGTTWNLLASDGGTQTSTGSGAAGSTTVAAGYQFNVGATGYPFSAQPDFLTNSINVQSAGNGASTLLVAFTQTNMNSFTGTLGSSFTANSLMGSAQNVTISSYYSASNALYGGTLLQSKNFTTGPSTFVGTNALALTGPFSETTLYTLNFGAGNGTFNSTAQLTAVPEPATWGMMIMGFGLMGAALRSRKTKVAFA